MPEHLYEMHDRNGLRMRAGARVRLWFGHTGERSRGVWTISAVTETADAGQILLLELRNKRGEVKQGVRPNEVCLEDRMVPSSLLELRRGDRVYLAGGNAWAGFMGTVQGRSHTARGERPRVRLDPNQPGVPPGGTFTYVMSDDEFEPLDDRRASLAHGLDGCLESGGGDDGGKAGALPLQPRRRGGAA